MDMLARREHAVAELKQKLCGRGFEADAVNAAVDQLAAQGLVSDERFVEAYVLSRREKGYGPLRIRLELVQRGVAAGLIRDSLDHSDAKWRESVRRVRRKRFGAAVPADVKERARQARFLQGRGFTADHIRAVLSEEDVLIDGD
ncbi:MAG TPA: regulatory protein RecX [Gammaproteobacteria bacterium]|nr:regulatory protein RecX [Gammaproteobacteria bacterium]